MADRTVPILDTDGAMPARPPANAGTVTYPPRATFGPRVQLDYQLVLVHAGSATVAVDGMEREIPTGHVGLLLPGRSEFFTFARGRETRHSWIAATPSSLDDDVRRALDAAPLCLPLSAALQDCIDLANNSAGVDVEAHRPVLAAVARAAFALYLAEARHVHASRLSEHPAVTRARGVARRRAGEGIGVEELAREVELSAEHLVRLFRRDLGVTPGAFLRAERLAQGVYLLEHTGLTVADIAHRAGFASPHHFARLLRATTGMTPTELRARRWVGPPGVCNTAFSEAPPAAPDGRSR